MMNLKSIVTSLSILSATSTAALADSSFSVHAEGGVTITTGANVDVTTGPTIRDHRAPAQPVRTVKPVIRPVAWYQPTAPARDYNNGYHRPHPAPQPAPQPREPELIVSNPAWNAQSQFDIYGGWVGATSSNMRGYVTITQPTRINNGRESFDLTNAGKMDRIQLQGMRGQTKVTVVGVRFADGTIQHFNVNQTIEAGGAVTIDLPGVQNVLWINVNGSSSSNGAYQLLASS